MPVPIVTFGIVIMRASLRPINNMIMGQFKKADHNSMGYKFFSTIGFGTHKVETMIANAGKDKTKEDEKVDQSITEV